MDTERLIQTLRNVLRAKDREEEEFRRYNGFDWGYHGFQFTEASRDAAEEFGAALNEVVVEVVENITLSEGARGFLRVPLARRVMRHFWRKTWLF